MTGKRRLIWVLYPSYLLIMLLSILVVTWYASISSRNFFLKQTETDLEIRARFFQDRIQDLIDSSDPKEVDILCKQIGESTSTRITVILPSGKVIGDSQSDPETMDNHGDRPEFIGAVKDKKGISTRHSLTLDKNFMYVGIPVYKNDQLQMVIRTSIHVDVIDETIDRIQRKIILGGVIIALFTAIVCLIISRRISRPIEELRKNAEGISKGEYRFNRPNSNIEEIGNLHNAMKEMVNDLEERIATITSQRNEIEVILASMDEGIIAIDNRENIINLNRAAEEIFGTSNREAQGRSVQEAVRNRSFHDFIADVISGSDPVEKEITLFPGDEKYVSGHGTKMVDGDGRQIGALIVLNDITRVKKLENIRRDFVANVSHEIKTPITAIKGFVETLREGDVSNEEDRRRFLSIISNHVNRLEAVINDLLKLSRIEKDSESEDIEFDNEKIINVLKTAIEICNPAADEKNISIKLECDESVEAKVNSSLLEQAIVNLLDNAIKYSENSKKVFIRSVMDKNNVEIAVTDEGKGIEKEHLPRLFERFYRVDKARSRKLGGTGLGLAIVKHIVQAHSGTISVDSTPLKGSTFKMILPRK
ncbi:MAG: PAS domain S-box protein [Deltaproteobacteria bacterium]|nr:PAS domain S-box protein [Deltaproteobacteria bacterium]